MITGDAVKRFAGCFVNQGLMKSVRYQDDAGTHFLLHVKTSLSDVEIKWAVRQKGILINCLSEYCFADADKYHGILVIHYSDMDEATLKLVIAAFEEIFL